LRPHHVDPTCLLLHPRPLDSVITSLMYSVSFVLGTFGNGLVMYIIAFQMKKRTAPVILIWNLALADFIFALTLPAWIMHTVNLYKWPHSAFACRILPFIITHNMYTSVLFICIMSLNRCTAILHPIHNKLCWSHKLTLPVTCTFAWLMSAILAAPVLVYRTLLEINDGFFSVYKTILKIDTAAAYSYDQVEFRRAIICWTLIKLVIAFLIPSIIILTCYTLIFIQVRAVNAMTAMPQGRAQRNRRTTTLIVAAVLAYFITWTPYYIVDALELASFMNLSNLRLMDAKPVVTSLACLNACMNPPLYAYILRTFRRKAGRISMLGKAADAALSSEKQEAQSMTSATTTIVETDN
uniref:G-protein coupled receptors family 1 profile domain-containing protein n=1 Tax=Eptatretus burgeri TaxID=7764 RepID=A0A8C4QCG3_EPTBU